MSKRVIKISLSENSIAEAIKQVEQLKREIELKTKALTERLAMLGVREASYRFTSAIYDGVNDSAVTVEPIENGWRILAEGQAVFFIEFGSGVYHNASEPYPIPRPSGVVGIGEYGEGKGQQTSWAYYGEPGTNGVVHTKANGDTIVVTHGNPASMPMWYASQEMLENVSSIVREVFGN